MERFRQRLQAVCYSKLVIELGGITNIQIWVTVRSPRAG